MKKLYLLLLSVSIISFGQSIKNTFQSWYDFNGSYTFNEQWKIYGDAGYRISSGDITYNRVYIRQCGSLQLNNTFILHAGIRLFLTFDEGKTT